MKYILCLMIITTTSIFTMETSTVPSLKILCLRAIYKKLPSELIQELAEFSKKEMMRERSSIHEERYRMTQEQMRHLRISYQVRGLDPFGYSIEGYLDNHKSIRSYWL